MNRFMAYCCLAAVVLSLLSAACVEKTNHQLALQEENAGSLGTISLVMTRPNTFVIIPDDDPSTRYFATNLPDSMKIDQLRVRFSGVKGSAPANARLVGIPFELNKIERLK